MQHPTPRGEILYGLHSVLECLRAGRRRVHDLVIAPGREHHLMLELQPLAAAAKIPLRELPASELDRITRSPHHQGIAAHVDPYPYAEFEAWLTQGEPDPAGVLYVLLDQVQDPQNLGAILRTALGCGVDGLVITKDRCAAVTPAVVRASAGASEWCPVAQVTNLVSAIKLMKKYEIWVVGLEAQAEKSLYAYNFSGGHALILGAEGKGLRRLVRESCDTLLSIPIDGAVGSYNVSVASAIVLGEVKRQRIRPKLP